MILREIFKKLQGKRKELQAIQKSMEFPKNNTVDNFNRDLVIQEALNVLNRPIQLSPDSLARQIRPEQNGE